MSQVILLELGISDDLLKRNMLKVSSINSFR